MTSRARASLRWALALRRLLQWRPRLRWVVACGIVAGLLAIVVSFLIPVTTTFTVVAETEYVTGVTARAASLTWELREAVVCAGPRPTVRPNRRVDVGGPCGGAPFAIEDFSGYLDLESSVAFEVERLADGPLRIALRRDAAVPSRDGADPAALPVRLRYRSPTQQPERLQEPIFIRVSDPQALAAAGRPLAFTVLATDLAFGREAALQSVSSQPLLRSGMVRVAGTTLVGNRPYAAREVTLKYGDYVSAHPAERHALFSCLFRADERPALQSIFRVESRELVIRGFYSEPQVESLTFFDRVTNDALLAVVWSVLGIGLTVAAGFAGVRRHERVRDG